MYTASAVLPSGSVSPVNTTAYRVSPTSIRRSAPSADPVPDPGGDGREGVLEEGPLDQLRVRAALGQAQLPADLVEAAQADVPRDGPPRRLDPAVHDECVELVGQRPRLTILAVVADLPPQGRLALLGRLPQLDGDASLFGEPVDGIAGQGGLDPDHVQGGKLGPSPQAVFFLHGRSSKKAPPPPSSCWCCFCFFSVSRVKS